MASISLLVFFVLSHLLLFHSAELPNCSSFNCGKFSIIGFPFFNTKYPFCGGLLAVNCDGTPSTIQLEWGGRQNEVIKISYTNTTQSTRIKDSLLLDYLNTQKCESVTNWTFPTIIQTVFLRLLFLNVQSFKSYFG